MRFCGRTFRRRAGFTLLELILALGLMSMVLASMYASMNVAFRARRAADRNVMPIRSAAIAADLVCQDLESVPPPTGILAGPFIGTYADGAQPNTELDVLDFYTVGEDVPPAQQTQVLQEGMRHVELAVRTDVDPPMLVRRVTRNLLSTIQDDTEEEILCRGVRSFALRYFDGTTWLEDWDSTQSNNTLPQAIDITLQLQADPSLTTAQAQNQPYSTIRRVIPLACATPPDQSDSGSSSSGSGSAP